MEGCRQLFVQFYKNCLGLWAKETFSTFVAALRYNLPVGRQVFLRKGSKKPARPFRRGFQLLSASPWAEVYLFSFCMKEISDSPMAIRYTLMKNAAYYQAVITLLCTNKCKITHFYG